MTKNYVKKHKGHKVPEGMVHFNNDNGCFYNEDKTEYVYSGNPHADPRIVASKYLADAAIELPEQDLPNWDDQPQDGDVWIVDNNNVHAGDWYHRMNANNQFLQVGNTGFCYNHSLIAEGLITVHKRPIAIEDKEWLPVVGEKIIICFDDADHEALNDNELRIDGSEVAFIGAVVSSVGQTIFVFEDDDNFSDCYPSEYFNPLKTAEELEREEFIDACFAVTPWGRTDASIEIFGSMFDAGFTAPKGEG